MTDKEKFLSIQTYEEFDKKRGEFRELSMADKEIREHAGKIFPKLKNHTTEELYKTTPYQQCKDCQNWRGFDGCKLYPSVLKEKPKLSDGIFCSYHTIKVLSSEIKK